MLPKDFEKFEMLIDSFSYPDFLSSDLKLKKNQKQKIQD